MSQHPQSKSKLDSESVREFNSDQKPKKNKHDNDEHLTDDSHMEMEGMIGKYSPKSPRAKENNHKDHDKHTDRSPSLKRNESHFEESSTSSVKQKSSGQIRSTEKYHDSDGNLQHSRPTKSPSGSRKNLEHYEHGHLLEPHKSALSSSGKRKDHKDKDKDKDHKDKEHKDKDHHKDKDSHSPMNPHRAKDLRSEHSHKDHSDHHRTKEIKSEHSHHHSPTASHRSKELKSEHSHKEDHSPSLSHRARDHHHAEHSPNVLHRSKELKSEHSHKEDHSPATLRVSTKADKNEDSHSPSSHHRSKGDTPRGESHKDFSSSVRNKSSLSGKREPHKIQTEDPPQIFLSTADEPKEPKELKDSSTKPSKTISVPFRHKDKSEKDKEKDHKEHDKEDGKVVQSDPESISRVVEVHREFAQTKKGLGDFERQRILGKGGIGHVYLVRLKGTDQLYAMKVLRKQDMIEMKKVKRVLTEREVLATADHPFIATLYYSFQSKTQLCFIMQYCAGGEFYRWILRQPGGCLTEDQARFYAAEVLLALEYLHSKGFIYRDLKPENVLMHASGHIMLTDFDLSKHATNPVCPRVVTKLYSKDTGVVAEPDLVTNSFVGTEEYLAPEIIKGTGHGATVDYWTFGILIYEMLFGTTPFRGKSREETFSKIQKNSLSFPEHKRYGSLSKNCKKLLTALLHANPRKRLGSNGGATDVKDHPFFKDVKWQLLRQSTPPIVPNLTGAGDMQYFNKLDDDWAWDQDEINPDDLGKADPWKQFQTLQFEERDNADREADSQYAKDRVGK